MKCENIWSLVTRCPMHFCLPINSWLSLWRKILDTRQTSVPANNEKPYHKNGGVWSISNQFFQSWECGTSVFDGDFLMRKAAPRPKLSARSPASAVPSASREKCEERRRRSGDGRNAGIGMAGSGRKIPTLPRSLERARAEAKESQGKERKDSKDAKDTREDAKENRAELRNTEKRDRALTLLATSTSDSIKERAQVFIQKHQVAIVLPERPQGPEGTAAPNQADSDAPEIAQAVTKVAEVPQVTSKDPKVGTESGTTAESQLAQVQKGIFWFFSCLFTCLLLDSTGFSRRLMPFPLVELSPLPRC